MSDDAKLDDLLPDLDPEEVARQHAIALEHAQRMAKDPELRKVAQDAQHAEDDGSVLASDRAEHIDPTTVPPSVHLKQTATRVRLKELPNPRHLKTKPALRAPALPDAIGTEAPIASEAPVALPRRKPPVAALSLAAIAIVIAFVGAVIVRSWGASNRQQPTDGTARASSQPTPSQDAPGTASPSGAAADVRDDTPGPPPSASVAPESRGKPTAPQTAKTNGPRPPPTVSASPAKPEGPAPSTTFTPPFPVQGDRK